MGKQYLGDGVYVEVESGMLKLTANGEGMTNTIYLELDVYDELVDYVAKRRHVAP